jgi:predicted  nucleic acid-binding Zn-ribbon protein
MAVAKVESQESEAQQKLRAVMRDVTRALAHPGPELEESRDALERAVVPVKRELVRLGRPLTAEAPRMHDEPVPISEARQAQLAAIAAVCELLESARHIRARANVALFQRR